MQVDFYQLAAAPVERVLPRIAERVLSAGGRLLVVVGDAVLAATLDDALWHYAPESFLPHGRAGGGDDARQPILIAATVTAINDARNVALADGVWRDEALSFDRTFHFFDATTLVAARAAWKALASRDGIERRFWTQDEGGKWAQQA